MGKIFKITVLTAVLLFLGVVISLQVRSTIQTNTEKAKAVTKLEQLRSYFDSEKNLNTKLEEDNKKLEDLKLQYMKEAADLKDDDEIKQLMAYLEQLKLKAGVVDVKGPGIVIKLNDADLKNSLLKNKDIIDPNELIIHDTYILDSLNELKKAGAQAISVNNERIVTISETICAGTTIRINKKRFAVPYEIKAIGDPELLEKVFMDSQVTAVMLSRGIQVDVKKTKDLEIPKYNDTGYNLNEVLEKMEVIKSEAE